MNPRWILIRRLRGPVFLLTFGLTAILHQWGVLSFGESWPLYLIVAGVLALLERLAFTLPPAGTAPYPGPGGYGGPSGYGQPWPPPYGQPYGTPAPSYGPATVDPNAGSTAIVPANPNDITPEGRR